MKPLIIIQARMGSTRLPGKVLAKVSGKSLLWYQIERLKKCQNVSGIIIATSDAQNDDLIAKFSKENHIECFRGSEDDVLDRYYQCAKKHEASDVVRITADCPLIEPRLTDEAVAIYQKDKKLDIVRTGPTYPEGFDTEVFSFKALEIAWKEAKLKSEREHVTVFLYKDEKRFHQKTLSLNKDYSFLRLTVDEKEDLEAVRTILEKLYKKKGILFSFNDILTLYKDEASLFKKNIHIVRNEGYIKSLKEDKVVR